MGKQVNYGGSLKLEYLKKLEEKGYINPYLTISYVDGNVDVPQGTGKLENKEIPFISPLYLRIGADVKYGKFYLSTRWNILDKQRTGVIEDNSEKRRTLDGYVLGNLSMGVNLGKYLNLYANFSNLLDARYRTLNEMNANDNYALRGMPQSPIRWTGGIKLRW
ncbi:MAG: hypothetical protein OHK0038_21080 [Flammeovirgaceae bacterium]